MGSLNLNARRSLRRKRRVVEAVANATNSLVELRRKFTKRDAIGHAAVGFRGELFGGFVPQLRMRVGVDADQKRRAMKNNGGNVLRRQHGRAHVGRAVRLLRLFADVRPDFAFKAGMGRARGELAFGLRCAVTEQDFGPASRAWVLRVAVGTRLNDNGKPVVHRRDVGLGSYPEVSLAEAREKARELRKQVRGGIDPIEQKKQDREALRVQQSKAKTFRECAEVVIANKSRELKNAKHVAQWQSTLETYAYPTIGERIVGTITKADVVAVLEPIWQTKNETANRLRGRIETILDYAKAMEYREGDNPAAWKGALEPILGKVNREVKAQPSLPYREIGAFMAELRKREGVSPRALEFAILTATRSGEVFGATWDEIDLKAKLPLWQSRYVHQRSGARLP